MFKIPFTTQQEMKNPAPPGHRHEQAKQIACSLAAQKLAASAIQAQLRTMYNATTMPDEEIGSLVEWAIAQDYEPAEVWTRRRRASRRRGRQCDRPSLSPAQRIERYLGDFRCSVEQLSKASPIEVPSDPAAQTILTLDKLYSPDDLINIVDSHALLPDGNGQLKARPRGCGRMLKRDDWITRIRQSGTPQSMAGAWLRMNPVNGHGVGDANVTAFRYCLLESDDLPEDLQISFLAKLKQPIAMIVTTGGRSVHAWIRINAATEAEYDETVGLFLKKLQPWGWDDANKNPGRLSRLPGARREIGAKGDGLQRLLYLNAEPTGNSIL